MSQLFEDFLSLDTPEHGAEFWQEFDMKLSQRLAVEEAATGGKPLAWRPAFSFAAAALVIVFVALLAAFPKLRGREGPVRELALGGGGETIETVQATLTVESESDALDLFAYDEEQAALNGLMEEENGQSPEDVLLAMAEEWEAAYDEMTLDAAYEQGAYDFVEELFEELSLDEY